MPGYEISMRTFRALLGEDNPKAMLAFLNGLTDHRFTGVFAFEGEDLRTVCMFDREAPDATFSGSVPVHSSYCVFLREGETPFAIENSLFDVRVDEHPKRDVYRSYFGVAVKDGQGKLLGSLCHFDPHPVSMPHHAGEFLKLAAPLVAYLIRDYRR